MDQLGRLAGRHRAICSLVVIAACLRLITMIAYIPVIWYNDAFEYVGVALRTTPYPVRPDGYSFVLKALEPFHSFTLIVLLQHLLGLAMGLGIYATAGRLGLPAWGACLAAAPILFDAYQLELEHMPLSDTVFTSILLLAVALAAVRRPADYKASIAIGLLAAAALLTRPAALPVVAVLGIYLLVERIGWRKILASIAAFAIPVLMYAGWYQSSHGAFAIDSSTGIQLYGRVAGFADCNKMKPSPKLRPLCPEVPGTLAPAPRWVWYGTSPLNKIPGYNFSPQKDRLALSFAAKAILSQPLDYAGVVRRDVIRLFSWSRGNYPNAYTVAGYEFDNSPWQVADIAPSLGSTKQNLIKYGRGNPDTRVNRTWASVLHGYQRIFFVRGPLLAAMFLLGLLGLVPRDKGATPQTRRPLALALLTAAGLTFVPILTVQLDYRYIMPALAFAPLAAALGAARLWRSYVLSRDAHRADAADTPRGAVN